DVREVGLLRANGVNHLKGLVEIEVGDMLFTLEGVEHKYLGALKFFQCFGRNVVGVSDVTEVSDTEAQHGQTEVHNQKRHHRNAVYAERLSVNSVKVESGNAGIVFFCKSIRVFAT